MTVVINLTCVAILTPSFMLRNVPPPASFNSKVVGRSAEPAQPSSLVSIINHGNIRLNSEIGL